MTDHTDAIQAEIDAAGRAGGGIVRIPAGTWNIRPKKAAVQAYHGSNSVPFALTIAHDNITLKGAGEHLTKLNFQLHDGRPGSEWDVANGVLVRGSGILVKGGNTYNTRRRNIEICDIELDGGGRRTGNQGWPANLSTGDGWDVTHKGIVFDWDKHVDDVRLRRVLAHHWWGEIVYSGGSNVLATLAEDCHFHTTNADCWSSGGRNTLRRNRMHNAEHAAIIGTQDTTPTHTRPTAANGQTRSATFVSSATGPRRTASPWCRSSIGTSLRAIRTVFILGRIRHWSEEARCPTASKSLIRLPLLS